MGLLRKRLTCYDSAIVEYCAAHGDLFEFRLSPQLDDCLFWAYPFWYVPDEKNLRPRSVDINPREFAWVLLNSREVPQGHVVGLTCSQPTCVQGTHLMLWSGAWDDYVKKYSIFNLRVINDLLRTYAPSGSCNLKRKEMKKEQLDMVMRKLLPVNIKQWYPNIMTKIKKHTRVEGDHWLWLRWGEVRPRSQPVIKVDGNEISVRRLLFTLKNPTNSWTYERVENTEGVEVTALCEYPIYCVQPTHCSVLQKPLEQGRYPADAKYDSITQFVYVIRDGSVVILDRGRGRLPGTLPHLPVDSSIAKPTKTPPAVIRARSKMQVEEFSETLITDIFYSYIRDPNYDRVAAKHGVLPQQVAQAVILKRAQELTSGVEPPAKHDPDLEGTFL